MLIFVKRVRRGIYRVLFFLIVSLLILKSAISQTANYFAPKINIPTSPEAALIGRFGDIPVSYYTGTANTSIPLYTVQEGNIRLPISLNYHSSGIKVDDQATWVGLGWDLSPEGTITQEIRGKSDEEDIGSSCVDPDYTFFVSRFNVVQDKSHTYLRQIGRRTAPESCFIEPNWEHQDPYCAVDKLIRGFGQPDIYSYNFGGYSGKFYINPVSHQVVLLDKNEAIYFEKVNNDLITATTLDGTVYRFGTVEKVYGGDVSIEYTGKTYKLDKITLLSGKKIELSYSDSKYTEMAYYESANINTFATGSPIFSKSTLTYHTKKTLTQITTTDAIINFNLESRDDINIETDDNTKRLRSIDILSKADNKITRTFEFSYSYFPYNYTGTPTENGTYPSFITSHVSALGKRLKLDQVQEIGYDVNEIQVRTKPAYKFEYDLSVTMPLKVSYAKDIWGYYNGEENSSLLPDLDYFDYFYLPEYAVINQTLSYPYAGAKRFSDNSFAGAYLLKKITYATGGYTEMAYEPNSFNNQFIPDKTKTVYKNYLVQDNSVTGSNPNYKTFKLSKATTIRFENRINNGKGNYNNVTPYTKQQMEGCYIKFFKFKMVGGSPQLTLIKQWDLSAVLDTEFDTNGGKVWNENLRVEFDPDPNPTFVYRVEVNFPDNLNNSLLSSIAGVSSLFSFYDDTDVNIAESNQCGMRVKTIKSYTATGNLVSNKLITYSNGKLLNRFRPLSVYKANHLDVAGVANGNGYEYISFYKKISISSSDFGINGGTLIGYGKVEERELAVSSEDNGKKIYWYHNEENKTQQGCPNIPDLKNGFVEKEEIFDKQNNRLLDKVYIYTVLQPAEPRFVCVNVVPLSTGSKIPCANLYLEPTPYTIQYYDANNQGYEGSQYGYNVYTINSEWNKLEKIITTQYSSGQEFKTNEIYTYNPEGKIRTQKTINSKGQDLITKYYYPPDLLIHPSSDNYLISVHNTGTPVITEQYIGTSLLSKQRIVHGSVNNAPTLMPQYVFSQSGTYPEEKRVTINSYDDKGNVTQYTLENNTPIAFIWNTDKTLLVAKIENATYSEAIAVHSNSGDLRSALPNSLVTTYTYKPLIGMTSETDPNGRTVYYSYDAFGRLEIVRDQDGKIIKKICYNYYGQSDECTTSASWQNTGNTRCKPCPSNSNYSSNVLQNEQRDLNPNSATYNQTQWVDAGTSSSCGVAVYENEGSPYCEQNGSGQNTGNQLQLQRDKNPCSLTYNQTQVVLVGYNTTTCPLPTTCNWSNCSGPQYRCVYGTCEEGYKVYTDSYYDQETGMTVCVYHYEWSDGTWSHDYYENNPGGVFCPIMAFN